MSGQASQGRARARGVPEPGALSQGLLVFAFTCLHERGGRGSPHHARRPPPPGVARLEGGQEAQGGEAVEDVLDVGLLGALEGGHHVGDGPLGGALGDQVADGGDLLGQLLRPSRGGGGDRNGAGLGRAILPCLHLVQLVLGGRLGGFGSLRVLEFGP